MLHEIMRWRSPAHLNVNPIVRVFILAEMFLWGAMNLILPIFALFVTTIPGGSIEIAATVYSVYMLTRVITELLSGRFFAKANDDKKILVTIVGMVVMSLSYIGFAFTPSVIFLYVFYAVLGLGIGVVSPVKNALFSMHLDKHKETMEWGVLDAMVFFCIALAAALGGFIAKTYGFPALFLLAAAINILGIIPYILFIKHNGYHEEKVPFLLRFFVKPSKPQLPLENERM